VPNHLEVIKRFVVAGTVTATVFLDVESINLAVILWAIGIFLIITYRETVKDRLDWLSDSHCKFVAWRAILTDTWCLAAPILGGGLFLASCSLAGQPIRLIEWLGATAISFAVIGYLHIRAKHGRYRYKFDHSTAEGQLALACSLTSAIPIAISPTAAFILVWNMSSMWLWSHLTVRAFDSLIGHIHEAQLWASVPLLAMVITGHYLPTLAYLATATFISSLIIQLPRWRQP
jgi:hypothetical protein